MSDLFFSAAATSAAAPLVWVPARVVAFVAGEVPGQERHLRLRRRVRRLLLRRLLRLLRLLLGRRRVR